MLKPLLLISSVLLFELAAAPAPGRMVQEATPAPAPAPSASAAKNPVKPTAESQAKAKKMFAVDCEMCHGPSGTGKTDLAKDLQLSLQDWTDPKTLAAKSDGDIFDLIRKGKDKMPAEDAARAKDDDVWNLVIYVRNLAKEHSAVAAK